MKRWTLPAAGALLTGSFLAAGTIHAGELFDDVSKDHWADAYIHDVYDAGIIHGYPDGSFQPDTHMTRAEAAYFVQNLLNLENHLEGADFRDAGEDHEAAEAIGAVAAAGIMQGADGYFRPDDNVTRAEMSQLIANAYDLPPASTPVNFEDIDENHWGFEAVASLHETGVIEGTSAAAFSPDRSITRAEAATIISRSLNHEEDKTDDTEALIHDVMKQNLNVESYTFDGTMDFHVDLPDDENNEFDTNTEINSDLEGAFQAEPLIVETVQTLDMNDDMMEPIQEASVVTEDAVYTKVSDDELQTYPEEWTGKFIEQTVPEDSGFDFNYDQIQEASLALYEPMIEALGSEAIDVLPAGEVEALAHVDHDYALHYELTEDDLVALFDAVEEDILPEFEELLETPELAAMNQEMEDIQTEQPADFDEALELMLDSLDIETMEFYQAIDEDGYITYDTGSISLAFDIEGDQVEFAIDYAVNMENFNEEVAFTYGIPSEENIITMEELLEWQEEQFENEMPDFDEDEFLENNE